MKLRLSDLDIMLCLDLMDGGSPHWLEQLLQDVH
jgi:hypothetical protein